MYYTDSNGGVKGGVILLIIQEKSSGSKATKD